MKNLLRKILMWCGYELKKITQKPKPTVRTPRFITQKDIPIDIEIQAACKPRPTDRVYGKISYLEDENFLYESRKSYYDKVEQRYLDSLKE